MKVHETFDEAIDRIASRMTQSGDAERVDVRPVWTTSPRPVWSAWRVAGLVGAAAVLLALAIVRTPRIEERTADSSIDASAFAPWAPLRAAVSDARSGGEVDTAARVPTRVRESRVADRDESWGIPFLDRPTALAIAPSSMPGIDVDAAAVDAIEVIPLSIGVMDPDRTGDAKER